MCTCSITAIGAVCTGGPTGSAAKALHGGIGRACMVYVLGLRVVTQHLGEKAVGCIPVVLQPSHVVGLSANLLRHPSASKHADRPAACSSVEGGCLRPGCGRHVCVHQSSSVQSPPRHGVGRTE